MGFFEFLTKKVAVKPKKADKAESTPDEKVSADPTSGLKRGNYAHIDEFRPRSFDDVAAIIDCLMGGKPAIVYLTEFAIRRRNAYLTYSRARHTRFTATSEKSATRRIYSRLKRNKGLP